MSRCCGRAAHLGDADISVFALFGISSGFLCIWSVTRYHPTCTGDWVDGLNGPGGVSVPLEGVMCLPL